MSKILVVVPVHFRPFASWIVDVSFQSLVGTSILFTQSRASRETTGSRRSQFQLIQFQQLRNQSLLLFRCRQFRPLSSLTTGRNPEAETSVPSLTYHLTMTANQIMFQRKRRKNITFSEMFSSYVLLEELVIIITRSVKTHLALSDTVEGLATLVGRVKCTVAWPWIVDLLLLSHPHCRLLPLQLMKDDNHFYRINHENSWAQLDNLHMLARDN